MIIKAKDLLGLQIVSLKEGKKLENVDDIVYDPQENKVLALVADKGGWFSEAKVILYQDIKKIGPDAIIVETDNVLIAANRVQERIAHITKDDKYLTQTKIITEDGKELGHVSDILFDDTNGIVQELEVSQGLKNMQSGKKRVNVNDIITIGKDATIVRGYVEAEVQAQAEQNIQEKKNTVQGIAQAATQKLQAATDAARTKVEQAKNDPQNQERWETIKAKTTGAIDAVTQKATDAKEGVKENRQQDILGKYANRNILLPDGTILLHQGEMITPAIIEAAELNGLTQQVVMSAQNDRPTFPDTRLNQYNVPPARTM